MNWCAKPVRRDRERLPELAPAIVGLACVVTACASDRRNSTGDAPDTMPVLLGDSLPFAYPPGLYMQLVDDSVTLRLHLDRYGRPVAESTRVAVPAAHAEFDSSAVIGSRDLVFSPAMREGKPVPVTILFPVVFRVPTAPSPSPGAGAGKRD